jgi:hypothetical protein
MLDTIGAGERYRTADEQVNFFAPRILVSILSFTNSLTRLTIIEKGEL